MSITQLQLSSIAKILAETEREFLMVERFIFNVQQQINIKKADRESRKLIIAELKQELNKLDQEY